MTHEPLNPTGRLLSCGMPEEACPYHTGGSDSCKNLHIPTSCHTGPQGTTVGHSQQELLTALGTGASRLLVGKDLIQLESCLPPAHESDVLTLVAEGWMLIESEIIEAVAHAIHHRAHLVPEHLPTLHLALAELLTNAVEHGNLGLSSERDAPINHEDWFDAYQTKVRLALASPQGRLPVIVQARIGAGHVSISVQDQGEGFDIQAHLQRTMADDAATGRGLPLLMNLLNNTLTYSHGGRRAQFHLTIRPNHDSIMPTRASIRENGRVLLLTCRPQMFQEYQRYLENHGFQQVHMATQSLTQVEAIEQYQPHLVLLDDNLPDHASPTILDDLVGKRNANCTVIMMGDNPTVDDRMQAYHLGAADYLPLSCDSDELVIRCEYHLLNSRSLHQLGRMARKFTADLERARAFQNDLLPDPSTLSNLARRHGVEMSVHYQGCDTLAGDYWVVKHLDSKHLALCMVDFTGHGVIAALNTVQLHTLLHGESDLHHPEAVALLLNHHLSRLLSAGSFATYFYGVFNTQTGHLAYCAGGMPPAIVRHAGGKFTTLLTAGLPLAIGPNLQPETRHIDLKDGDTLILYSDALTDSIHRDGNRWDTRQLLDNLQQLPPMATPQRIITHLLDSFYAQVELPVPDDLTLLALRREIACAL